MIGNIRGKPVLHQDIIIFQCIGIRAPVLSLWTVLGFLKVGGRCCVLRMGCVKAKHQQSK